MPENREHLSTRNKAEGMPSKWPTRMWINQPSTLQPHHDLDGTNVLAVYEYDNTYSVFFLSGPKISQQMSGLSLSLGWLTSS